MSDLLTELEARLARHAAADGCLCDSCVVTRRAVEEIKRLRAQHDQYQSGITENLLAAGLYRRASRWRLLARKRREQVRGIERNADEVIEHLKADLLRERLKPNELRAELNQTRKELGEEVDRMATMMAERNSYYVETESLRADLARVEAERDEYLAGMVKNAESAARHARNERNALKRMEYAISERDTLKASRDAILDSRNQETLRGDLALSDLAVALHERDCARELLTSTESQLNDHLQARLAAERFMNVALAANHRLVDEQRELYVEINERAEERDLAESIVCAANLELGWALAGEAHWLEQCRRVTEDFEALDAKHRRLIVEHLTAVGQCVEEHETRSVVGSYGSEGEY